MLRNLASTALCTLALISIPQITVAEDVLLTSFDGQNSIKGAITKFDGETFIISTNIGQMELSVDQVYCEGAACPVKNVVYEWGDGKIGQPVSITSNDKKLMIKGTLKSFTAEDAVVETNFGLMKFPLANTTCTGPGCPIKVERVEYVFADMNVVQHQHQKPVVTDSSYPETGHEKPYEIEPEVRMAGPGEVVEVMMPIALKTYAARMGGTLDLFDDHMAETVDVGEMKHHKGGLGFEIMDTQNNRIVGLLGHHAKKPNEQMLMLASRKTDIAFITGGATPKDAAILAKAGHGNVNALDQQHVVAVDGLVGIVSPNNPINQISLSNLRRVFAGEITNWSQLGGPNAAINTYTFRTGHETFYKTRDVLLKPAGLEVGNNVIERKLTREIVGDVIRDPFGIGFVSYSRKGDAKALSLVMECGIKTAASPTTIKTEKYPLMQRTVAYTRANETKASVLDFMDFLESADLDKGIENAGFISLAVEKDSLANAYALVSDQATYYSNTYVVKSANALLNTMIGRDSLSTVFRFQTGSQILDSRAQRDLKRVVAFMVENPDAEFTVVGFSDSIGSFNANQNLALSRARAVIKQLQNTDILGETRNTRISAIGAGELYPIACNDNKAGRAQNRRVEIWMKS